MKPDEDDGASISRIGPVPTMQHEDDATTPRSRPSTEARAAAAAQRAANDVVSGYARKLAAYLGIAGIGAGAGVGGTIAVNGPARAPEVVQPGSPVTVVTDPTPATSQAERCECVCKSTEETRILLDYAEAFADFVDLPEAQRPRLRRPPQRDD